MVGNAGAGEKWISQKWLSNETNRQSMTHRMANICFGTYWSWHTDGMFVAVKMKDINSIFNLNSNRVKSFFPTNYFSVLNHFAILQRARQWMCCTCRMISKVFYNRNLCYVIKERGIGRFEYLGLITNDLLQSPMLKSILYFMVLALYTFLVKTAVIFLSYAECRDILICFFLYAVIIWTILDLYIPLTLAMSLFEISYWLIKCSFGQDIVAK